MLASALGAAGCGGVDESNFSTKSQAASARFQQAQAEVDQAAQRAKQAETRMFKGALQVEKQ